MSDQKMKGRVLVIDDEEVVHASLKRILSRLDLEVEAVFAAQEGIDRLQAEPFDLVITDLMMPKMNGVEMLEVFQERGIKVPTLMITGYPTIRTAIKAMRLGAMDYIAKPFRRKELLGPVKRALRMEDTPNEQESLEQPLGAGLTPDSLTPGERVMLPNHTWAEFQQDGTFLIGLEGSFIRAVGDIETIEGPQEMDLLEQGYIGLSLTAVDGDVHGVAMPLSGQVSAVNTDALSTPETLTEEVWVVRIVPSQLAKELELLVKKH